MPIAPHAFTMTMAVTLAVVACHDGQASPAGDAGSDAAGTDEAGASCPASPLVQLTFSSDGRWLAGALGDGTVLLEDLTAAGAGRRVAVPRGALTRIALSENGGLLAVGHGRAVGLWDTASGTLARALDVAEGESVSLRFSDDPSPSLLAGVGPPRTGTDNLKIWRTSDGVLIGSLAGSPHAAFTLADSAVVLVDEAQGGYDVATFGGRRLHQEVFSAALRLTAFSPDGAFLAGVSDGTSAATPEQRLVLVSVRDGATVWTGVTRERHTRQLLFLEDPARVVQAGDRVEVHDSGDGHVIAALPALEGAGALTASSDGAEIAAVAADGRVVMVSTATGVTRAPAGALGSCRR